MRLLLDTHVALWAMQGSRALSVRARRFLRDATAVHVSAASLWEIAIKSSLGKIDIDIDVFASKLSEAGFLPLPVTWAHAAQSRKLPRLHRDPFDRMLVAQAICEPLRLLTHDAALARYSDLVALI